jgi:chromosome segregation ATPase
VHDPRIDPIEKMTKGNNDAIAVLGQQVREDRDKLEDVSQTNKEIMKRGGMAEKELMQQGGRIDYVEKQTERIREETEKTNAAVKREHEVVQNFMKHIQERLEAEEKLLAESAKENAAMRERLEKYDAVQQKQPPAQVNVVLKNHGRRRR